MAIVKLLIHSFVKRYQTTPPVFDSFSDTNVMAHGVTLVSSTPMFYFLIIFSRVSRPLVLDRRPGEGPEKL